MVNKFGSKQLSKNQKDLERFYVISLAKPGFILQCIKGYGVKLIDSQAKEQTIKVQQYEETYKHVKYKNYRIVVEGNKVCPVCPLNFMMKSNKKHVCDNQVLNSVKILLKHSLGTILRICGVQSCFPTFESAKRMVNYVFGPNLDFRLPGERGTFSLPLIFILSNKERYIIDDKVQVYCYQCKLNASSDNPSHLTNEPDKSNSSTNTKNRLIDHLISHEKTQGVGRMLFKLSDTDLEQLTLMGYKMAFVRKKDKTLIEKKIESIKYSKSEIDQLKESPNLFRNNDDEIDFEYPVFDQNEAADDLVFPLAEEIIEESDNEEEAGTVISDNIEERFSDNSNERLSNKRKNYDTSSIASKKPRYNSRSKINRNDYHINDDQISNNSNVVNKNDGGSTGEESTVDNQNTGKPTNNNLDTDNSNHDNQNDSGSTGEESTVDNQNTGKP